MTAAAMKYNGRSDEAMETDGEEEKDQGGQV